MCVCARTALVERVHNSFTQLKVGRVESKLLATPVCVQVDASDWQHALVVSITIAVPREQTLSLAVSFVFMFPFKASPSQKTGITEAMKFFPSDSAWHRAPAVCLPLYMSTLVSGPTEHLGS